MHALQQEKLHVTFLIIHRKMHV